MSIIYETLNRLEMESTGQADRSDRDAVKRLAGKRIRPPARRWATVILLVLTGTGLALWHPNSPLSGFNQLPLANALGETVASEKTDHDLSSVPAGERVSNQIQPASQKNETATVEGLSAAPPVQSSAEETVEFDGLPAKADESPIATQPQEENLEVASAGPEKVEVAAARPNAAPAVSEALPAQLNRVSLQTQPSARTTAVASAGPVKVEVVAAKSNAAPAVSEELPARVNKVSLQSQPSEPIAAVAGTNISLVNAPSAKPKPKPKLAVPHKQQPKAQLAGVGRTAEPNTVDRVIEQAGYALSRGRYQQALVALEKLSPIPDRRVDYWLIKGNAHLRIGQLDSAEKALALAQALAPMNAQIAVQRAILRQEKGDHVTALRLLKDAGERNPNVPEIFLNQGYSEQALGAVQDARRSFRVFLRITEGRSLYTEQRKLVNEWLAQFPSTSN